MTQEAATAIAVGVAASGTFGTGIAIGALLMKREVTRVMEAVEKISAIDIKRLEAHFLSVHVHASKLTEHGMRLDRAEERIDDIEVRIRPLERRP